MTDHVDGDAPTSGLTEANKLTAEVEVWKTVVQVQQHFNDIGWRIRSLAITALTFTLGATFFGYLNAHHVLVFGLSVNPAAAVPLLGLVIWSLFWFADGVWYHRLLTGAGRAATPLEQNLQKQGIPAQLSQSITEESRKPWRRFEMNSTRKLNWFYRAGWIVLLVVVVAVLFLPDGSKFAPASAPASPAASTQSVIAPPTKSAVTPARTRP